MGLRKRTRRSIVVHTRYKEAYDRIRACHQTGLDGLPVEHLKILGRSGTGKSTLLCDYQDQYPPRVEQDRTIIPVVRAPVPTSPTPVRLAGRILRAMKSPAWNKGNEEERTFQLVTLTENCSVELFLLDEVQHVVDRGRAKTHARVADWIKEFADEVERPIVLAGLPRVQLLDASNEQFARRFSSECLLDSFSKDTDDEALIEALIGAFCEELDLKLDGTLATSEFALRLSYAAHGTYGYMWKLFVQIDRRLRGEGRNVATILDFLDAFLLCIWAEAPPNRQPFHDDFDWEELTKPGEPFAPDAPAAGW